MSKPFIFGVATSGSNFTDREQETKRLLANFQNGVNTILISPRRWGKTSLVKRVCQMANSDKRRMVYLDIFSCRNEEEFYEAFATAVLKQTSSKLEEWIEHTKTFLSRISPKISMGIDPFNDFSISFESKPKSESMDDILQLPEKIAKERGFQIVICIDEFQQIAEFKDSKTFQKRLRTVWQLQESVSFCLFGSKKYLMNELFEKKNLPFYKFGDVVYLPKIGTTDWVSYICERFATTGKHISTELAKKVCLTVDNHSSYVQQLAWLLWVQTEKTANEENFTSALKDLLDQNSILFQRETENLSAYQMNFLRAVAQGVHQEFSTREALIKYNLGSSSNIAIIKKALVKNELIEVDNKRVTLTDPVFGLWFKRDIK